MICRWQAGSSYYMQCWFLEFQKTVLAQLTQLHATIERLGRRYEPETSEFHVQKLTTLLEVDNLEQQLKERSHRSLMVTISSSDCVHDSNHSVDLK